MRKLVLVLLCITMSCGARHKARIQRPVTPQEVKREKVKFLVIASAVIVGALIVNNHVDKRN